MRQTVGLNPRQLDGTQASFFRCAICDAHTKFLWVGCHRVMKIVLCKSCLLGAIDLMDAAYLDPKYDPIKLAGITYRGGKIDGIT